jgi:hypothetical protein
LTSPFENHTPDFQQKTPAIFVIAGVSSSKEARPLFKLVHPHDELSASRQVVSPNGFPDRLKRDGVMLALAALIS